MAFTARLSSVSTGVRPLYTSVVSAAVAAQRKQGREIINLVYGQNTLPIPKSAAEAGAKCYQEQTFPYADTPGYFPLRETYADTFTRMGISNVTADKVVIGCGVLELLELACQAILRPGDKGLVISPYYFLYPHRIEKFGAEVIKARTTFESRHKITAETLDSILKAHPKIKLLILNTPNNPAATMYTRLELLDLAEVIGRHDLWVFSDEVYHEITFGREHVSFASVNEEMAQRTITFDSASKTIALGGERIGALTSGNKAFIAEVIKNKTHATFSTGLAGQMATNAALRDPFLAQYIKDTAAAFKANRDAVANIMLGNFPSEVCYHLPEGTFYFSFEIPLNLKIPGQYQNDFDVSTRFALYLVNHKFVAVTPGQACGYPNLIRLSVAIDEQSLRQVSRIGEALHELGVQ